MVMAGRDTRPWDGQNYIHERDGTIMANHAWLGSPRGGRRKMQAQSQAAGVIFPKNAGAGSPVASSPRTTPDENEGDKGAGVRSGHGAGPKRTYEMKTVMGSVMLGEDVTCPNNSRVDAECAGLKTRLKSLQKPFRQTGLSQSSVMDTVLYGRDLDFSGDDPTAAYFDRYADHAGDRSAHQGRKPFRKSTMSQSTTIDSLMYGRDIDNSGEDPHAEYVKKLAREERAGLHAHTKNTAHYVSHRFDLQPQPRPQMCTSVDNVVFGKERCGQRITHLIDPKDSYAGVRSGAKVVQSPRAHGDDPCADTSGEVRMPLPAREHPSRIRRSDTEPALAQERMGTPQGSRQGPQQSPQTPQCRAREVPLDQPSPSPAQGASGPLATSPRARNPFGGPARSSPSATPCGSVSAPSVCSSARGSPPQNLAMAFADFASASSRGSFKPPPRWR